MDKLQTEKHQGIVRLPNNFVEAIYSLSVDAKKLLMSVILHMNSSNKIQVYRRDVIGEVGIDLKNLKPKHREKIIEELMTKIITIRDTSDPDNKWVKMQLLRLTRYEDGILETSVYPELLPFFEEAQEKLFTRLHIQNIKPLTSIYAIRLYEMAKQYQDTGWRIDTIEDFRKMLQLDDKYKDNKDFRKWVLEVAKKQINKRTDIKIDYELIKEGRKFTKIRWKIVKDLQRIEQKDNKKFQKDNNFTELEMNLNRKYKGKSFKGNNGLNWTILRIKFINDREVEVFATDLQNEETKKMTIEELQNLS